MQHATALLCPFFPSGRWLVLTCCLPMILVFALSPGLLLGQAPPISESTPDQHIVVVLDNSGSMNVPMKGDRGLTRLQAAKNALRVVLQSLPAHAQVGVVVLNSNNGQNWIVPLAPIDPEHAVQAIDQIKAAGGTFLGSFMKIGTDALLQSRQNDHYGQYRLLVVTDGEASDPRRVERFLPDILARGITLDVIGVDMASRHSLATRVHTYRRADDPASLTQAVREVFAETSIAAGDASEDDFDLVAGLPDAVAEAALAALATADNRPIGSNSSRGGANAASTTGDPRHKHANHPQKERKRPGVFTMLITAVVLIQVAKAILRKIRNR